MLLWTLGFSYLFKILLSILLGIHLEVEFLGHVVIPCLTFVESHTILKHRFTLGHLIKKKKKHLYVEGWDDFQLLKIQQDQVCLLDSGALIQA